MSKTIYELNDEARALDALLDEHLSENGGEVTPEAEAILSEWFQESEADLDAKLDAYAAVIAEREAFIAARTAEAKRIAALARSDENVVASMKERLKWFFEERGITKHETANHKFTLATNGGKLPLAINADFLPEELPKCFQKVTVDYDKRAIREVLENDGYLEFAHLGERGRSVRIR